MRVCFFLTVAGHILRYRGSGESFVKRNTRQEQPLTCAADVAEFLIHYQNGEKYRLSFTQFSLRPYRGLNISLTDIQIG